MIDLKTVSVQNIVVCEVSSTWGRKQVADLLKCVTSTLATYMYSVNSLVIA